MLAVRPSAVIAASVVEVAGVDTYDLRHRVLGLPSGQVGCIADTEAVHLGMRPADGRQRLVGVVSLAEHPIPGQLADMIAFRLWALAVDMRCRSRGVGGALVEAAVERARIAGAELLWVEEPDSVFGFYTRQGFRSVGETLLDFDTGETHHLLVLDLAVRTRRC